MKLCTTDIIENRAFLLFVVLFPCNLYFNSTNTNMDQSTLLSLRGASFQLWVDADCD